MHTKGKFEIVDEQENMPYRRGEVLKNKDEVPQQSGDFGKEMLELKMQLYCQFEVSSMILSLDPKLVIQGSNSRLGGLTGIFLEIPARSQTSLKVRFG